ncbi:MAG: Ni/Fe hydrogenase subunit alpha [Actinomycetales bacterium]|nr:Ni/Fe hydrogenase subunit alpha [Actinomycetales bacterium]
MADQVTGEHPTSPRTRTVETGYLARVEGEGGMHIRVVDGAVEQVRLTIFEPPRLFEAFLRGRSFTEAPDLTARICGICPVAYQSAATMAMEAICRVEVGARLRELRRLLYCGEWIASHALHVYLLHAPDFLGLPSVVEIARDHPEVVDRALRMKKIGNELMQVVGGRAIHPVNVRVGGFFRTPTRPELEALLPELEWGLDAARQTVRWAASLDVPRFEQDYEFVALDDGDRYPIDRGDRVRSSRGLDIPVAEFSDHVVEEHVEHANALHATLRERGPYLVGPLARYALAGDLLSEAARAAAEEVGLPRTVRNPFRSIVVRAVELVEAFHEALRIVHAYERPSSPAVECVPRAGTGHGVSEAPRGLIYHRYRIDGTGRILDATIVPPTAQNQPQIERDLADLVTAYLDLPHDELTLRCEQAIRNYDPCISCATHTLDVTVDRVERD